MRLAKDGKTLERIRSKAESESQQAVIRFRDQNKNLKVFKGLGLLFHIPNGGKRSKAEAARFKAEGVVSGVPDLCLPVARTGWHGLFVEMKAPKGVLSDAQKEWGESLLAEGYAVRVCRSSSDAIETIISYLKGELPK